VFSQDVQNYSILARSIDPVNNTLKDITIFDNSKPNVTTTVTAESGVIYFSDQLKKLIMELHNGEIHESNSSNKNVYRKLLFKDHKIAMNAEQFSFEQSGPGGQKGDRELGAEEMLLIVDSLNTIGERYKKDFTQKLDTYYFEDSSAVVSTSTRKSISRSGLILRAQDRIRANESTLKAAMSRIKFNKQEVNRYWVEIHKKYSLPVACVVFILLGAPLGTMTRKGGFGMAAGISLFFFLIYWAFLIGGEKLADRGLLSPFWGMWSANILLGLLGIWLTVKSAKERVTISFDFLTKIIPSKYRKLLFNNENS
jgi:lipopolysaccharide export system permease protein